MIYSTHHCHSLTPPLSQAFVLLTYTMTAFLLWSRILCFMRIFPNRTFAVIPMRLISSHDCGSTTEQSFLLYFYHCSGWKVDAHSWLLDILSASFIPNALWPNLLHKHFVFSCSTQRPTSHNISILHMWG